MTFTPLHLKNRERNPEYYDTSRDMETALVWSAIHQTLLSMDRSDLVGYIRSVKISERIVVITTTRPIANAELRVYSEQILSHANASLVRIGSIARERIMWK